MKMSTSIFWIITFNELIRLHWSSSIQEEDSSNHKIGPSQSKAKQLLESKIELTVSDDVTSHKPLQGTEMLLLWAFNFVGICSGFILSRNAYLWKIRYHDIYWTVHSTSTICDIAKRKRNSNEPFAIF